MNEGETTGRKGKLNAKTFLIRDGKHLYVTLPVLVYKPGNGEEGKGYAQMMDYFDRQVVEKLEAINLATDWCTLQPMNSSPSGVDGDDDD